MMTAREETRFAFGRNWQKFLSVVDERRIASAVKSVQQMLDCDDLSDKTFLDIGCGSGLFSLAAVRLGARVRSFDSDPHSVACTQEMRRRFAPGASWEITAGSILDHEFVSSLAPSDVVYSWGVLHHTGAMWPALEQTCHLVKRGGLLAISIYNDQGGSSRRWRLIKRIYNHSPRVLQWGLAAGFAILHETKQTLIRLVRMQNPLPFGDWSRKRRDRGMSPWYDMIDWIGGYPFEVARPEEIFNFCRERGFELRYLTTQAGGYGCNEFVFRKAVSIEAT